MTLLDLAKFPMRAPMMSVPCGVDADLWEAVNIHSFLNAIQTITPPRYK